MSVLQRLATKQAIILILLLNLIVFIGIFFTKDNTVTLGVMLGFSASTVVLFGTILFYLRVISRYDRMYSTLKTFVETNPDKGIHLFDRDGPLHEIPPDEITPTDLNSLEGGQMRDLADKDD